MTSAWSLTVTIAATTLADRPSAQELAPGQAPAKSALERDLPQVGPSAPIATSWTDQPFTGCG